MNHNLDGADAGRHESFARLQPFELPPVTTMAATPQSIGWTQTVHERSMARRRERIAVAAYLLAEARGFEPGHDSQDWLRPQSHIDAIDAGSCRG